MPSPASRRRFAELCVSWSTLNPIAAMFDTEGFEPVAEEQVEAAGQRRTLVARYHAGVDWTDPEQVARIVCVYSEAVIDWLTDAETRQWPAPGVKPPEIRAFIRGLQRDGIPIDDEGHLLPGSVVSLQLEDLSLLEDPEVIVEHLRRIGDNVDQDPAAAIGSAKELVESVCRLILKDYGQTLPKKASLTDLYKAAARELSLNREAIVGDSEASTAAKKALQGMASTVGALGELRNAMGTGHGKDRPSPALARHARMAAHAAQGIGGFMLETWEERRRRERAA